MRNSKVLSITLPPEMVAEAGKLARKEGRTMSELMREAFRQYKRQQEWNQANAYGRAKASQLGLTEADVVRIVKEFRAQERSRSAPGKRRA